MKPLLILISLFFIIPAVSQTERKVEVDESSYNFKSGKHNALKAKVYETDIKVVSRKWEDLMRDYKGKTSGNKDEMFSDNAMISNLNGNSPSDVYAAFSDAGEGHSYIYVAVDLGGAYLNSSEHRDSYNMMKKILYDFAKGVSEYSVNEQIKGAEKIFATMESDQKKLISENEKLHKDIETYNEKIKKAEEDIKTNLTNQETKKKEVEDQQKVMDGLKEKLKSIN